MKDDDEECFTLTLHGRMHQASPAKEATRLLESLRWFQESVFPERDFVKEFIEPLRLKVVIDTETYFRSYEKAVVLEKQPNGDPIKPLYREIAPRMICFWAACANCVMAEAFAIDSPTVAWRYLMDGWFWHGLLLGRCSIKTIAAHSFDANEAKLKVDPKQKDKAMVKEFWQAWQATPLDRNGKKKYKSKSAFAKDMLDKFPNLESQRVIADKWCPVWEKENITPPAK